MKSIYKYCKQYLILVIMFIAIGGLVFIKLSCTYSEIHPDYKLLQSAEHLTKKWFDIVSSEKQRLCIVSDSESLVENSGLLGDDYSKMTTTLGSLESKELTTNPAYAAVILKMMLKTGIDSSSTIGLVISGSFPALASSTLAAAQTINAKVIMFSSIGASSYGANQPLATWTDIENWLRQSGGLKYKTSVLTLGAENDRGEGMLEDADSIFYSAVARSGHNLYMPRTLEESIDYKTNYLLENKISLLINIGGNHAAIGNCYHAATLPNGLNSPKKICSDDERGIISRVAERGIPFIHLLNIKDLSLKNGIPLEPGISYGDSSGIYYISEINKTAVGGLLLLLILLLSYHKIKNLSEGKENA